MTMTEEYATQILRMRSPSSSNNNSASKEPTERVQGFNVNASSGTTKNEVEALRALRISSARTNASSSTITNEGTTNNEKEEDDEKQEEEFDVMALPMTPKKGGGPSTDVDKKDTEELMTPRSLSKRIGKPDIKVMLATGNNEPIDVMRGRGIVTSMTLRAKAEGIKRVPEKMFTTTGGKSRFSSSSNSNGRNNEDDEDDGNKVNLVLPAEVLRNAAQKEKQSNENDTEEENNTFDDPKEYRKLMVKLSDLSYIHIKAAVGVDNATGNVIERDFWLPLDETKTIGDLKRYVEEANTL